MYLGIARYIDNSKGMCKGNYPFAPPSSKCTAVRRSSKHLDGHVKLVMCIHMYLM